MTTPPASPPLPHLPPPSPPPPPPAIVASEFPSTLKRTRKATRLRSLATRPPGAERSVVHIDPATGKDDSRRDIQHLEGSPCYSEGFDMGGYLAEFDIPEASNGRTKKKVLQTVGERWRQFKSDLTRKWALAVDKDSVDDTQCEMGPVLSDPQRPLLGGCAEKGTGYPKAKHRPHVLYCGGYEYLEQKLMAEKTKKKQEEAAQSESTEGWKMAHTKKTGQMTSEAAKEIAEKIEQASQGSFVPHGRQDLLTVAAIGRPEHPGRVRVAGAAPEELEQLTQQIRDQLEESINEKVTQQLMLSFSQMQSQLQSQIQSQGLALPPEPEVGPSIACVSTKGSCVDPSLTDPDMGDSDKCGLYIEENPSRLVALGIVYEGSTAVGVEEVKDAEAFVPVPTDEALNTFLAWPTHLVKCLSQQAVVSPAKPPDRPNHEVDDPLYLITLTDLSKIVRGGQCLSISVIELWILHLTETSMRTGNSNVYGFLEPQSIQRSRQSQFESESYMKSWMQSSKRDVYLGAYRMAQTGKWSSFFLRKVFFALKGLDDTPQPKSKAGARWIVVKTIGSREIEGASHPIGTVLSQS
ncbi:hypothetical protein HKD37_11G032219 [Glycine soja]